MTSPTPPVVPPTVSTETVNHVISPSTGDSGNTIILLVGIATAVNTYDAFSKGHGGPIKGVLAGFGVGVITLLFGAMNAGFGVALAGLFLLGSLLNSRDAILNLIPKPSA